VLDSILATINDPDAIEANEKREAEKERQRLAAIEANATASWHDIAASRRESSLDTYRATTPEQRTILAGLREYVADLPARLRSGEGVLLYGPVGTGKDHLALGIVREALLTHRHTARRINGVDWYGAVRDAMDTSQTEKSLVAELASPQWLIVSDPLPPFDALTNHQASMLYRVIDKRREDGKPTIVTVNVVDGAEGARRMGAATWDRLKDRAWVFACAWDSYRKPARVFGAK
jgi:DNA replication protein DnaC